MATPSTNTRPTPEHIFNTLNAYQQTLALRTAIELDIFSAIADGSTDTAAIAKKAGAAERGVQSLCNYLTVLGFLTKQDNRYALTQESSIFLNKRSPAYMGAISGFLANDHMMNKFASLTEAVKKGGSAAGHGGNQEPNDDMWVAFARSMAAITIPASAFIAQLTGMPQGKACQVLDIAAGHGMYGITMARQNPNAQVTALDWPNVLEVAKQHAASAGVADRYKTRPGSAFDADLGNGYDYVLLTNIFHHFDHPTCEKLMKRVHAALKPGGQAITLEFVPNEDRVTPPTPAMFSLIMLATTDFGDAYTLSEYEKMFRNAGFSSTVLHQVPDMPQQVLVSEK
ncbi:MAG: methyltransferase domain-containing protein [Acidobacteriota bacterium]|nr:methyltransferase domain-containing protein [Acidobacteriota bacterium]